MNYSQYYEEVHAIAQYIADTAMDEHNNDREEAEEYINDTLLHETIDGHEYVIYTCNNLDVIQHSQNEDYLEENLGSESVMAALKTGISGLHCAMAFWAMYTDVQDIIGDVLDLVELKLEEVANAS